MYAITSVIHGAEATIRVDDQQPRELVIEDETDRVVILLTPDFIQKLQDVLNGEQQTAMLGAGR